jgi:hypothetical protein
MTFFCTQSMAQKKETPFFFDAISLSINKSDVKNEDAKGIFGFGFGVYHSGFKKKNLTRLVK